MGFPSLSLNSFLVVFDVPVEVLRLLEMSCRGVSAISGGVVSWSGSLFSVVWDRVDMECSVDVSLEMAFSGCCNNELCEGVSVESYACLVVCSCGSCVICWSWCLVMVVSCSVCCMGHRCLNTCEDEVPASGVPLGCADRSRDVGCGCILVTWSEIFSRWNDPRPWETVASKT